MEIAPQKCAITSYILRNNKRVQSNTIFKINNIIINHIPLLKFKEYLGAPIARSHEIKLKSSIKLIENTKLKIQKLMVSGLRINQKIDAIRRFIIPSFDYLMSISSIKANDLKTINQLIRNSINKCINAISTPKPMFHLQWKSGGLGIPKLKESRGGDKVIEINNRKGDKKSLKQADC